MSELRYPLFTDEQKQSFSRESEHHPDQKNLVELLESEDISEILKYYQIDTERVGLREIEPGVFSLPITNPLQLPGILPPGYALKGGAARALLLRQLEIDPTAEPRDIDVIRIISDEPEPGLDKKIIETFESEFVKYKIETISDFESYFNTRDITQNQIFATQDTIITTRACLLDTVRRIIRLTDFEYNSENYLDPIGPKMKIRLLRLYSDALHRYGIESEIPDMPKEMWAQETEHVSTFYIALQFEKACQQGEAVAQTFIETLKEADIFPKKIKTINDAYDFLMETIDDRNFYFRAAPIQIYKEEQAFLRDHPDNSKFDNLDTKEPMRPRGVRKMKVA